MNCNYAFDDCSILNMCSVEIPAPFRDIFKADRLYSPNFIKLNDFSNYLKSNKNIPYRFIPSNFEKNSIRVAKELLAKKSINPLMVRGLNSKIIDYLNEFSEKVKQDFQTIQKSDNITNLKHLFTKSEQKLTREGNIPEDDDLKIMKGYEEFCCLGKKLLISMDEHFWGYKDLIFKELGIIIIPEWDCDKCIFSK